MCQVWAEMICDSVVDAEAGSRYLNVCLWGVGVCVRDPFSL